MSIWQFFIVAFPILVYIILCGQISLYAEEKGRHKLGYFVVSLLCTPVFGAIMLIAAGERKGKI